MVCSGSGSGSGTGTGTGNGNDNENDDDNKTVFTCQIFDFCFFPFTFAPQSSAFLGSVFFREGVGFLRGSILKNIYILVLRPFQL